MLWLSGEQAVPRDKESEILEAKNSWQLKPNPKLIV